MEVETIEDLLKWLVAFHRRLNDWLCDNISTKNDEKLRLLIPYLRKHENNLQTIISRYLRELDKKILATWCAEFFNKPDAPSFPRFERKDKVEMGVNETVAKILNWHEELIDLLQFIINRPTTDEVIALLTEVLQLEEQESKRIAQSCNRLLDI